MIIGIILRVVDNSSDVVDVKTTTGLNKTTTLQPSYDREMLTMRF